MKKILLINPKYELEIRWVADEKSIGVRADYFPLGLATVAALSPEEFSIDIWDELVRGSIEGHDVEHSYDLVGVTSHSANLGRALKIGKYFREKGIPVAVGGPGVSSNPDRCRNHFDVLFIGEAEITWPRFLKEWKSGNHQTEYRQIEKPDVSLSPAPKWDSILSDLQWYAMGTVQTTRGCPNDCEFCDVIYLNGRLQRHKSIDQILEEVRVLQKLGVKSISFNDDNFTVDHPWAKKVLKELIALNNSFSEPLRYMTQLSIDVARDEKLLELLADANFYQVLIGVETPNRESLRETGKFGNLKGDLVEQVHKVLSYGIVVRGALIVGFDNDDKTIFYRQYDFIQKSCFPSISLHMLNAPVGTRLWRRLRGEGRVIDAFSIADTSTQRLFNNTIPKQMTRVELMEGFRDLYLRVFSWKSFRERMFGFVSLSRRPLNVRQELEPLDDLLKLGSGLNLNMEACDTMSDIFRFTEEKAPFLMGRVKEMVVQFIRYRKSAYEFIPGLQRQIDLESSGKLQIQLDTRPVTIPNGFREAYRSIFPAICHRVRMNLQDKSKVAETLVEVFVEFLVHEEGLRKMEEYHHSLLFEISDRTCARVNGQKLEDFSPRNDSEAEVPERIQTRLQDDVLKSVEQELMRLVHEKARRIAG